MELIDSGKCLRMAQAYKNLNSVKLAKITNTSPQQILRWRSNKNMKLHTIQLVTLALDITINDFITFNYK